MAVEVSEGVSPRVFAIIANTSAPGSIWEVVLPLKLMDREEAFAWIDQNATGHWGYAVLYVPPEWREQLPAA